MRSDAGVDRGILPRLNRRRQKNRVGIAGRPGAAAAVRVAASGIESIADALAGGRGQARRSGLIPREDAALGPRGAFPGLGVGATAHPRQAAMGKRRERRSNPWTKRTWDRSASGGSLGLPPRRLRALAPSAAPSRWGSEFLKQTRENSRRVSPGFGERFH